MTKSRGIMAKKKLWSPEEVELLVRLYSDTPTYQIALQLGVAVNRVYAKASDLGLRKSAEYLAGPDACRLRRGCGAGEQYRFKKGSVSWNKGLSYSPGGRSVETRFKPGYRGGRAVQIYQPIGAERISKDGYLQRKINDDLPFQKRWRGVHILVWEEVNGPLPKGHAIAFLDGNKRNCELSNLELVSRQELMRRNTYHQYGKEIAQLVQLRGAITRQINRRTKNV